MDHTHVRPYPLALLQRLLEDLDFTIQAMGNEPNGWQDLYILARKTSTPSPRRPCRRSRASRVSTCSCRRGSEGWEVALQAYGSDFTSSDDACLVLYVDPAQGSDEQMVLTAYENLGLDAENGPDVVVVSKAQDGADEASLARQVQGILADPVPAAWQGAGLGDGGGDGRGHAPGVRRPVTASALLGPQPGQVGIDHHLHQLAKLTWARQPSFPRLAGSPKSRSTSAGRMKRGILLDVLLPVETDVGEGDLDESLHGVRLAGRDDVVVGFSCCSISHIAST